MQPLWIAGVLLAALQAASAASLPVHREAPRDDAEDREASQLEWSGPVSPTVRSIAAALRESRRRGPEASKALIARIAAAGPETVEACFAILVQGRVPRVTAQDEPQKLSVPQRELVLSSLARLPAKDVRAALEALLLSPLDEDGAIVAVGILGAVGGSHDLERLAGLLPRDEQGGMRRLSKQALHSAYSRILAREVVPFARLAPLLEGPDDAAIQQALLVLADRRDARALRACFTLARSRPALAQTAVVLIPAFAGSNDMELVGEVAAWLRSAGEHGRTEWTRAVYTALGTFDEGEAVPALIDALDGEDAALRAPALAALHKICGVTLPADPAAWHAWFAVEQDWMRDSRASDRDVLLTLDPQQVVEVLRAYSDHRLFRSALAADLIPLLDRPEAELRQLTCSTLGRLGSREAVPALLEALDHPEPGVAQAARTALQVITGVPIPREGSRARSILVFDS